MPRVVAEHVIRRRHPDTGEREEIKPGTPFMASAEEARKLRKAGAIAPLGATTTRAETLARAEAGRLPAPKPEAPETDETEPTAEELADEEFSGFLDSAEKDALLEQAREMDIAGVSARWTVSTLRERLQEAYEASKTSALL